MSPESGCAATLRNTVSFQMIGVAPLRLGIGSFHAMLSPVAVDHFSGRPFSALAPVASGPRHCGQLSADTDTAAAATVIVSARNIRWVIFSCPRLVRTSRTTAFPHL